MFLATSGPATVLVCYQRQLFILAPLSALWPILWIVLILLEVLIRVSSRVVLYESDYTGLPGLMELSRLHCLNLLEYLICSVEYALLKEQVPPGVTGVTGLRLKITGSIFY